MPIVRQRERKRMTWNFGDILDAVEPVLPPDAPALIHAEERIGYKLETRAHATWAESPTIDYWRTGKVNKSSMLPLKKCA